jgi:hypothetical protein
MKSLVLFSYRQPVEGFKFRWGVLESRRDTEKHPVNNAAYRSDDPAFERSQHLDMVSTLEGVKAFYRQRQHWKVKIPFVGSLVKPFLAK